ncbi:MAG: NfeD family protein [Elusimicrobiota bacterium]|jgi:membrane protein implicated in regulation of membrane protease activity|nr:NfeD family protein [Elusimicrobiota bacterium]
MPSSYWLIAGLLLLIGEIFTLDFSLSCFGLACFVAALASALGLGLHWQLGICAAVIVILFFTLRPLAFKYFIKAKSYKSNVDEFIGKTASVYEVDIADAKKAKVKFDADEWAVAADEPLKNGDIVKISKIDGITLIVNKEEK